MKKLFALLMAAVLVLSFACVASAEIDPALIAAAKEDGELVVYGSCEEP